MKALIVRLSSIGDVVHTLPALAALARHGWEAGWLVEPAARPLLERHPLLGFVGRVPAAKRFAWGDARKVLGEARGRTYDVALDFQGLWKSAAWARLSGARRVVGFGARARREPLSRLLLHERVEQPPAAVHVVDKNLALLRSLGIEAMGSREFPLPPTAVEARSVAERLASLGLARFVLLNPGGGWQSKQWPAEEHGALARALGERGLRSLVTFGPGEEPLAERVVAASSGTAVLSFPTSLLEYVELARRAALVVGADTGPLHIACALGTPVVGLYGPTDPLRNGPFAAGDMVVRRVPPCAPCHRRECARHAQIMQTIPVEEVLAAVLSRLEAARRQGDVAL